MLRRQRDEPVSHTEKERVGGDKECADMLFVDCTKGGIYIACTMHFQNQELPPEAVRRRLDCMQLMRAAGILWSHKISDGGGSRY